MNFWHRLSSKHWLNSLLNSLLFWSWGRLVKSSLHLGLSSGESCNHRLLLFILFCLFLCLLIFLDLLCSSFLCVFLSFNILLKVWVLHLFIDKFILMLSHGCDRSEALKVISVFIFFDFYLLSSSFFLNKRLSEFLSLFFVLFVLVLINACELLDWYRS